MKCKVQGIPRNFRYRILAIDEEEYIMDMGGSFWKILFPFLFWITPTPVYKLPSSDIAKKLKSPVMRQTKAGSFGSLGAGIGIFIATFLRPLADITALPDSSLINVVILLLVILFSFLLFASLYKKFKKKLEDTVSLEHLPTDKLWIRPNSVKHLVKFSTIYLFFLGLTLLFCYLSIAYPDIITQMFTAGALLFVLITSPAAVTMGVTTIKFKNEKETTISGKY